MSEHLNNPEFIRKNLMDDCSGCGERYLLEPATVNMAYWFANSPRHSFAHCTCPNCEYKTLIFIDQFGREALMQHGVELNEEMDNPPKNIIKIRKEIDDKNKPADVKEEEGEMEAQPELPTYELTDRMEKLVAHFGQTISNVLDKDPSLFWDEMEGPNDYRPYPMRWI